MSDSIQRVTSASWFERIKGAVVGVLIGLLLVVVMVAGLFWNEGRAVQTAQSLAEGAGAVIEVDGGSVDPANEGKLVHVSGKVTANGGLADEDFGIAVQGLRLSRAVEMYQWKETSRSETKTNMGGSEETVTTYSYSKAWDASEVDSTAFEKPEGHQNPALVIRSKAFQVVSGELGAFTLDKPVLDRIGGDEPMALTSAQAASIAASYPGSRRVSIADGKAYLGADPSAPALGDYRIGYELAPLDVVSIVARQVGNGFEPYKTMAGDELLMVDMGKMSAQKMFADAVSENTLITWLLRIGGFLLLALGFGLIMSPLGVILDVIPFLGSIARMGAGIVAFLLATLVGATTIAFAWFWYRPLLAIGILLVAAVAAWALARFGRSRGQVSPAPSAA